MTDRQQAAWSGMPLAALMVGLLLRLTGNETREGHDPANLREKPRLMVCLLGLRVVPSLCGAFPAPAGGFLERPPRSKRPVM